MSCSSSIPDNDIYDNRRFKNFHLEEIEKKIIYGKPACNNPENEGFDNSRYEFEGLSIKIRLFVILYSESRPYNLHFERPI